MRWNEEIKTAIILLVLHTTAAKPGKSTAPAVFEVINEQSRIDDKRILPYANPLAGNSLQNAKIHAQHQQAMFNAERMRQHRAQLMRWNKQPNRQQADSYMKAYQESQESHHLALEQMQSNVKEKRGRTRQERPLKDRPQLEPVKIARGDPNDKNRNHRSYGSIYGNMHKKRKVNTYPGPTYDQGVTIKPNGNVGLNNFDKDHASLYTEAIPSKTQYIYPKLYGQMQGYQSANDINALNTLLSKPPQEQLSQLNTLVHTAKETGTDTLNTPIDLFFYLKDPQSVQVEPTPAYTGPYAADYINHKDHTPITEEVDDVQDNKDVRVQTYTVPTVPTVLAQMNDDPTTTKSNYYKIEVEQTVSGNIPKNIDFTSHDKPNYEAMTYEKPLKFYAHGPSTEGVSYLQNQPTGVQHLSQDGTGVSAYGADDVSIKKKRIKRELDTDLFILGNETITTIKPSIVNQTLPLNETLTDLEINCTMIIKTINETIASNHTIDSDLVSNETLPTPEELKRNRFIQFDNAHQVGEAYDYDYTYYDDDPNSKSNKYDYSYESDYDPDYEFNPPDYDYEAPKFKPQHRPNRQKRPNANHNHNTDAEGKFSNRYSSFKHPNFYDYHPNPPNYNYAPSQQYGPPSQYSPPLQYEPSNQFGPPSNSYGQPIQQYPQPQYGPPAAQRGKPIVQYSHRPQPTDGPYPASGEIPPITSVIDSLEPVYMLTKSQIKDLVGHNNNKLNIEHLDVFQLSHEPKPKRPRYRPQKKKSRRRYPKKGRKNKIGKLRKLNKIVMF